MIEPSTPSRRNARTRQALQRFFEMVRAETRWGESVEDARRRRLLVRPVKVGGGYRRVGRMWRKCEAGSFAHPNKSITRSILRSSPQLRRPLCAAPNVESSLQETTLKCRASKILARKPNGVFRAVINDAL